MKQFHRRADGTVSTSVDGPEAGLFLSLVDEVHAVLEYADGDLRPIDPVLDRFFPEAYPTDSDASAEFRRFTTPDLRSRKTHNAAAIAESLAPALTADEPVPVILDEQQVQAWVRGLTDMRLMLAARVGIGAEPDPGLPVDAVEPLTEVYNWLGWVQDSLVRALDD